MKRIKQALCLALCALVILCTFWGCSKKQGAQTDSDAESSQAVSSQPTGPYTIGLIQYGEDPSFNTAREAFMSRLEEWAYNEDKVRIDYQNAQGDGEKAKSICKQFVEDGADLIVAISTPAAQAAVEAAKGSETMVLFAAESDPKAEGDKVTGVWGSASPAGVIQMAESAGPGLKTLGLLYNPDEPVSKSQAEEAKAYCQEKGITVAEAAVAKGASAEEVSKAAADLCGKADAVFTPLDGTVASSASDVAKACRDAKKPWYAMSDFMVQAGALAAESIDYTRLGYEATDMAVELMAGKTLSEVPVRELPDIGRYVNQTTFDTLRSVLKDPDGVLEDANFVADAVSAQ